MTIIRFQDPDAERQALGCLIAHGIPGKTWQNGETSVPQEGIELLEKRGIAFERIREATYEHLTPIRDFASEAVQ